MPKLGSHIVKYFQHTECNTHSRPPWCCVSGAFRHQSTPYVFQGGVGWGGGWCLAPLVLVVTGSLT